MAVMAHRIMAKILIITIQINSWWPPSKESVSTFPALMLLRLRDSCLYCLIIFGGIIFGMYSVLKNKNCFLMVAFIGREVVAIQSSIQPHYNSGKIIQSQDYTTKIIFLWNSLQWSFSMWHSFIKNSVTQAFSSYFFHQYQCCLNCVGPVVEILTKSLFVACRWHNDEWLVNNSTASTLPYYHKEMTKNFAHEDLENTILLLVNVNNPSMDCHVAWLVICNLNSDGLTK